MYWIIIIAILAYFFLRKKGRPQEVHGRLMGKRVPFSVSLSGCDLNWSSSSLMNGVAKAKVDGLEHVIVANTKNNPTNIDCIIRIRSVERTYSEEDLKLATDITKADNLKSETLTIGSENYPAVWLRGEIPESLEDDKYFENVMITGNNNILFFDLFIMNKSEPLKNTVSNDFSKIVKSLKGNF